MALDKGAKQDGEGPQHGSSAKKLAERPHFILGRFGGGNRVPAAADRCGLERTDLPRNSEVFRGKRIAAERLYPTENHGAGSSIFPLGTTLFPAIPFN
jgi:hypothetical protein